MNNRTTTRKTLTPTERHISRWRSRSTSRTIGLFRTSFLMAHSNDSPLMSIPRTATSGAPDPPCGLRRPFDGTQLGAARADIAFNFRRRRYHRPFRPDRDVPVRLQRPEGVLHDAIL